LIYLRWYLPHLDNDIAIYAVAAVVILIGLWLMSRIARYAGAAFYFLSAGVVAVALWDFAKPVHVGVVWAAIMAVLTRSILARAIACTSGETATRSSSCSREVRRSDSKGISIRQRRTGGTTD
jgi:hypothetical protein